MKLLNCKSILLTVLFTCTQAQADNVTLSITVIDQDKNPVANTIVSLRSETTIKYHADKVDLAVMDQVNKQFKPTVLAIRAGTEVNFPNSDNIRHQVYSFSKPKPFTLPLYSGDSGNVINFDKTGTIILGCNIHDRMLGYIHVVDTPFFTKSNEHGLATMTSIPKGQYELMFWHPKLSGQSLSKKPQQIDINKFTNTINISIEINKKQIKKKELSPLERKFRKIK